MPTQTDFVPADLDAARWENIEPLLSALQARPVATAPDLEQWLTDRSELDAACSEARANLYITMSCNTDDAPANAAYTTYIETVPPRLEPVSFELDKKHVALAAAIKLNPARYAVVERSRRAHVELFRPENVPIQTDLAKLSQEFDQIAGKQTVTFEGREQTLPQMARYLEQTQRSVRESAWRAIAARRLQDRAALNDVLDRMIARRHQMAQNAGFADFIGFSFKEKERFDYTPADCQAFWSAAERHIVPLVRRLDEQRRRALKSGDLRPWDMAVDIKGRPPLRPFEGGRDLLNKTVGVFERLDSRLAGMIRDLAANDGVRADEDGAAVRTECLDLDTRKGKRPGGYQYVRDRQRRPFIFMNAAGLQRDVMTMIHEAGHAFHSMLCASDPLVDYRHSPIEFAEVASMSMEHLTMPHWGTAFYASEEDLGRARRTHLEDSVTLLAWIATIDSFQHWMYANPTHTAAQRDAHWLTLDARFGHAISWKGLDEFRSSAWQKQSHVFTHPMYYIEYGIAQLGALQLWLKSRREGEKSAVDAYIRALTLGGSRPLPDLFAAAGLTFDFGESTIARVVEAVEAELTKLPE